MNKEKLKSLQDDMSYTPSGVEDLSVQTAMFLRRLVDLLADEDLVSAIAASPLQNETLASSIEVEMNESIPKKRKSKKRFGKK